MSLNALERRLQLADLEHCMRMDDQQQLVDYLESLTEENVHERAYRYDYIRQVFEKEFAEDYIALDKENKLVFDIVRLSGFCRKVFVQYDYPLKDGCELLHKAICQKIAVYIQPSH